MNEDEFSLLARRLLSSRGLGDQSNDNMDHSDCSDVILLFEVMISKEIRDFDYMDFAFEFYQREMNQHFATPTESKTRDDLATLAPFVFWSLLIDLPETDVNRLASAVSTDAIQQASKCLSGNEYSS